MNVPQSAAIRNADAEPASGLVCRFCKAALSHVFADLGMSPLANAYVPTARQAEPEMFYPLKAWVCDQCFLVQVGEFASPAHIFSDYAYFSSYSDSWLAHCRQYATESINRFGLNAESQVVEIASNDGYLLQYFQKAGIPVLGIEPAGNVAAAAREKGIPTISRFFGENAARELAAETGGADLLIANNVLAHVPDLNDFVAGMQRLLKPDGVFTAEFPHLLQLIRQTQFDTIYHEHFSYFSLGTVRRIFSQAGLEILDVVELSTHGGSLRVYGCHANAGRTVAAAVESLLRKEQEAGLDSLAGYQSFQGQVERAKRSFLRFLLDAADAGRTVAGYGAPAKGNTLLNYCGAGPELMAFTVDRNPHKQGMLLPGTRIPVRHPAALREARPDYIVILPWNIREEVMEGLPEVREWGGQFVVAIPETRIVGP